MQQQATESRELAALEELAKAASGLMPARQLDKREMSDIVNLAIGTLNDRQRMAVLLCKFEGLSYVDIADTMEMTPSAVKSLLSRARGNLREVLEPYLQCGLSPRDTNITERQNTERNTERNTEKKIIEQPNGENQG